MKEGKEYESGVERKCSPCFKKGWCMCLSSQIPECLGPFTDVEDNVKKYREWCEEERNIADLNRAGRNVVLNTYLRNVESLDKENKVRVRKNVQKKSAGDPPLQLSLEWGELPPWHKK